MSVLVLASVVYLAAVVQTALADAMEVRQVTPDLLALAAVAWLLVAGGPRGFLAAGAVGLAGDLIAPGPLGLGAVGYLAAGYAVTRLRPRIAADWLPVQVAVVWAAATFVSAGAALGPRLLGETSLPAATLAVRSLGVGLYTAGVGLPVLMVLSWFRSPPAARQRPLGES